MTEQTPPAAPEGLPPAEAPAWVAPERPLVAEPPPIPAWAGRNRTPLRKLDLVVLLAIVALTALTHMTRLGAPGDRLAPSDESCTKYPPLGAECFEMIPLDEVHYVPDARDVLRFGSESDTRAPGESGSFVVHPPAGKWFIAAGIKLFGDNPAGWRFFGALFGVAGVAVMYLLARRLWASPWWAALAALLLGVEGLWFVQSRVAMLDIYAAFFVLVGVWLLLEDLGRSSPIERRRRWWRIAAGVAFGLALATKWSVLPFLGVAILVALAYDIGGARWLYREGPPRRPRWLAGAIVRRALTTGGTLFVLPLVLYTASYAGWFLDDHRYDPPRCESSGSLAVRWACYQREMFDFHKNLKKYEVEQDEDAPAETKPGHPYFGHGITWPYIGRPVAHAYESIGEGENEQRVHVLGLPNPAIWWPAFALGLIAPLWWALRRIVVVVSLGRIRWPERKRDPVLPILALIFAAGYLPYAAADLVHRPVFLFYATPLVPFLALMVVHFLVRLVARRPEASWVAIGYAVVAALTFAYFYPVLSAWPLGGDGVLGWQAHMWFRGDCLAEDTIKVLCWI